MQSTTTTDKIARVVEIERVEWRGVAVPETFPCFMCRVGRGEWMVRMDQGVVRVNAVLCRKCAELPAEKIAEHFLGEEDAG